MSNLLASLLGIFVATNQAAAASNFVAQTTGISVPVPAQNDPVEKEYERILEMDDAAQEEVDKWIQESNALDAKGGSIPGAILAARIDQRFAPVRKAYEEFIANNPKHARARLAYGSFLYDIREEEDGVKQWQKALEIDPKNPAIYNNLANHYGHRGPVTNAFDYYERAIKLSPNEPVYLHNLATTTYLFRKDAQEYYKISEKGVFDRSLELYQKAIKLDPNNFALATDYAQSFYGIRPLRTEDALKAWNDALKAAGDQIEREGVYIHMARVEMNSRLFAEAKKHLNMVTNEMYQVLKGRLTRKLEQLQSEPAGTKNSEPDDDKP